MEKIKSLVTSRRFWLAVAGLVVASAGAIGLELDPEMVQNVVLIVASWVLGDSIRETTKK